MRNFPYQAVLFDFDGVLCHDRFYDATFMAEKPELCEWVKTNIFGNRELVRNWMRGQMSSREVNEFVAKNFGIDFDELNNKFNDSIRLMKLDEKIKSLAERLTETGIKTAIVTDNMDIFSTITVSDKKLDKIFNVVSNSSDHGLLKQDANGQVFDNVLASLGINIENALHIDDSLKNVELFKAKGGDGFFYQDYQGLATFLGL